MVAGPAQWLLRRQQPQTPNPWPFSAVRGPLYGPGVPPASDEQPEMPRLTSASFPDRPSQGHPDLHPAFEHPLLDALIEDFVVFATIYIIKRGLSKLGPRRTRSRSSGNQKYQDSKADKNPGENPDIRHYHKLQIQGLESAGKADVARKCSVSGTRAVMMRHGASSTPGRLLFLERRRSVQSAKKALGKGLQRIGPPFEFGTKHRPFPPDPKELGQPIAVMFLRECVGRLGRS